jgi:caffeoyl-CoA O-methyltransferase
MGEKNLRHHEILLPVQPAILRNNDASRPEFYPELLNFLLLNSHIKFPEERFKLTLPEGITHADFGSNLVTLQFLEFLARLLQPKRVLEIGAFVGVSSMILASALTGTGKLVTLEKFSKFADAARTNFRDNKLDSRIELLEGDAAALTGEIEKRGPYDFIFLDGDKGNYEFYYKTFFPQLSVGGLFIVDDVLFHGDTLNATPETEKGAGVKNFLALAREQPGIFSVILPYGNGIMLIRKEK